MFDVPLKYGWLVYRDWARQYGSDIVHVQTLGVHIYVVNSAAAAKELFDKRPRVYSDKEQSVMMNELTGWHRNMALMPYGDYWRENRRLFHQHFRPLAVPQYRLKQAKVVRRLLQLLVDFQGNCVPHIRYMAGSMILDVVYAFDVLPGDPRLELVEKATYTATQIVNAGIFLVYVFPILKHVPAWFPGARFKRQAGNWRKLVDAMFEVPYYQFKAAMVHLLSRSRSRMYLKALLSLLSNADATDVSRLDEIFIALTGTAYAAGEETTVIALSTFILAMILHPEIQVFVQEELDRVIGRDRLPQVDDRQSLPRVTAVMNEVLRWHSPLPLATPHRAITDDDYKGYHIAAGSLVIGNSWAILHDDERYPDPYSFKPSRFLFDDGRLRDDVPFPIETFGYGRRISPGRYFALDTLFVAMSNLLAVFTIEAAVDENGEAVEVKEEFVPHVLSPPKPFKAHFKPRYSGADSLIRSAALADA
ncbi:uncharacterized protein PHACADRAFT_209390 [Phanerochaete carnosa HHB-10118-sp]|uniref:Cytochrome P450 n=1 Tax=Phanerochaete carnosa (strain HHB-10118-sp) TaxID=650164 RepID=K5VWG1_PHACS|nr:uncharacterized protein PHACADRAFT_209390 [Phanerochaete carnosa HHB-10118-sp]EKM55878.1 hypothetical protein PHACADRAFT_209390 [Phanerochaete carnosa HHB-10118-sp]